MAAISRIVLFEEKKYAPPPGYSHHRSVSTCHLANIAMRLGRQLKWDPEKEDFIGDEEASAMLSRPQRPQYAINV